jgi:hypothetical protein
VKPTNGRNAERTVPTPFSTASRTSVSRWFQHGAAAETQKRQETSLPENGRTKVEDTAERCLQTFFFQNELDI